MMTSTSDTTVTMCATTPLRESWEDMLAQFRSLGGTAENLGLGQSPQGPRLHTTDPTKRIVLQVPESLIFPVEDVTFTDGRIGIKDMAAGRGAEREFFDNYANTFSWGGGGRRESENFVAGLDALSSEVRELLVAGFGMGEFLEGSREDRTRRCFLRSRMKTWNGRNVLIPIVEIAGRDAAGLSYSVDGQGNLQIAGRVQDEVVINHGALDSFGLFRNTGEAHSQPQAYSLPLQLQFEGRTLTIERNLSARVGRGNFQIPLVRSGRDELVFSHLMIGNADFPRLSRGVFAALARESGASDANEIFDRILYLNRNRFLDLLAVLEPHEGPVITTLRRVARYQLEAMAQCIGTREI